MEIRVPDLSGLGTTHEVGPCQIAERLCGGANKPLRTEAIELQAGVSGAGLLHAHEPSGIAGEPETRRVVALLRLEQGQFVLTARPELPSVIGVGTDPCVLLDGGGAVGRCRS